jgi:la-related protein 6
MTVASAIRKSSMLELSRDGQLVKRSVQPAALEPPKPIRTVLAINLHENPTVESVTSAFAKYGELTQVRVIRPTSQLPAYLKEFTMWVPDIGTTNCAVIEFETQDEAQAACREINMANRQNGKLRVALLKVCDTY